MANYRTETDNVAPNHEAFFQNSIVLQNDVNSKPVQISININNNINFNLTRPISTPNGRNPNDTDTNMNENNAHQEVEENESDNYESASDQESLSQMSDAAFLTPPSTSDDTESDNPD